MRLFILAVLICATALGQQNVGNPEIVPTTISAETILLEAKTVAVRGETGTQMAGRGSFDPDGARAKEKVIAVLKKWGKYEVVDDPDKADIVIEVIEYQKNINLIRLANLVSEIKVFKGRVPDFGHPLWEGSASENFRKLPSTKVAESFRDYVSKLKPEITKETR
jgi:hypothetical protein